MAGEIALMSSEPDAARAMPRKDAASSWPICSGRAGLAVLAARLAAWGKGVFIAPGGKN
jgi:hypothetical protein